MLDLQANKKAGKAAPPPPKKVAVEDESSESEDESSEEVHFHTICVILCVMIKNACDYKKTLFHCLVPASYELSC